MPDLEWWIISFLVYKISLVILRIVNISFFSVTRPCDCVQLHETSRLHSPDIWSVFCEFVSLDDQTWHIITNNINWSKTIFNHKQDTKQRRICSFLLIVFWPLNEPDNQASVTLDPLSSARFTVKCKNMKRNLLPSSCLTFTTVLAQFRTRPCLAATPTTCRIWEKCKDRGTKETSAFSRRRQNSWA